MHVTLFLQPTQSITESFRIVTRLISPIDGVSWAQHEAVIPRSNLTDLHSIGQVMVEQFVLTMTNDISIGAYHLDVSVAAHGSEGSLSIYRRSSTAALDRITLGDVIVPWQGDIGMARPVGADFGNQVTLLGFEAADSVTPGTELEVRLYWEALKPPEDDYIVFVHLLDATGQLVASHDGSPVDGRYPATTWLPGEVVPDVHRMALDPQVSVGTYWLQVGMYSWPSMERLPIWDSHGVEQVGRVIALHSVEVH